MYITATYADFVNSETGSVHSSIEAPIGSVAIFPAIMGNGILPANMVNAVYHADADAAKAYRDTVDAEWKASPEGIEWAAKIEAARVARWAEVRAKIAQYKNQA